MQSLVLAVAECNFKVRVLTTFSEDNEPPAIHKNVEVLQPFKNWNLLEIGAILRVTQGYRPDVVHFVFPPSRLPGKAVALALPGVLQNFGQPGFVLQLQGQLPETLPLVLKYWLQMSQAVVVDSDFAKLKVSSLTESHRKLIFHVLQSEFHDIGSSESHWVTECFDDYVYACGPVKSLAQLSDSLETLQAFLKTSPKHGVVFHLHPDLAHYAQSGDLQGILREKQLETQVAVLKSVDAETNRQLIRNCHLVSLTHLPLGSKHITTALKMAREAGKQVLVQPSVVEFEHSMGDLWDLAVFPQQMDSSRKPGPSATPEHPTNLLDSLGNQLSRIYQSVLSQ